jgi:hypothetical protein
MQVRASLTTFLKGDALLLSFGSNSFQFLPAAVKLRNIFSGSSELRIKHLPMLAVLGVEIRVGKLRFEADDIFLRSQDLVFDRFQFLPFAPLELARPLRGY